MTNLDTREYGYGTRLTVRMPWSLYVGGRAMCSDGKVRAIHRIAHTADTWFSLPASVVVNHDGTRHTVSGYITIDTATGYSTPTDDDPLVVKFIAYSYGRNGHLLPGLAWKESA